METCARWCPARQLTSVRAAQEVSALINFERAMEDLAKSENAPKGIRQVSLHGSKLEASKHRELVELFRCAAPCSSRLQPPA